MHPKKIQSATLRSNKIKRCTERDNNIKESYKNIDNDNKIIILILINNQFSQFDSWSNPVKAIEMISKSSYSLKPKNVEMQVYAILRGCTYWNLSV